MTHKSASTFYANIWIGGDHNVAVQACREYCAENPLCVTVTPTSFVYVNGMETGVCVRLINYPRFPKTHDEINNEALKLAEFLRKKLCQDSYSIETPEVTDWVSYRAV